MKKGNDNLLQIKAKKLGVTDFVLERTCAEKYSALNLKNRASFADKATVSVSPKIVQLDLNLAPRVSHLPVERPWFRLVSCLPDFSRFHRCD